MLGWEGENSQSLGNVFLHPISQSGSLRRIFLYSLSQQGISIKLDTIPAGNEWDGWLTARQPLERQAAPQARTPVSEDDIPF